MSLYRRLIALCTCLLLLAGAFFAPAEEISTDPVMTAEEAEAVGIEVEGLATEDESEAAAAGAEDQPASIEGLTPLVYHQDQALCGHGHGYPHAGFAGWRKRRGVLHRRGRDDHGLRGVSHLCAAEYNGYVGYVIRTWVDENMTTLDPENTPPYAWCCPNMWPR